MVNKDKSSPLTDGTVYSRRKNFCPFSAHPLQDYASIIGEEKIEKLQRLAQRLEGHGLGDVILMSIKKLWKTTMGCGNSSPVKPSSMMPLYFQRFITSFHAGLYPSS
jgi:hypothetical protein